MKMFNTILGLTILLISVLNGAMMMNGFDVNASGNNDIAYYVLFPFSLAFAFLAKGMED